MVKYILLTYLLTYLLSAPSSSRTKKVEGYKYLANRVVATLKCSLCGKPRCVYAMSLNLNLFGQQLLEDYIYSCCAVIPSRSLYMASTIPCSSTIEHSYYAAKFRPEPVCVHCGSKDVLLASQKKLLLQFKIVYPVCFACSEHGKK